MNMDRSPKAPRDPRPHRVDPLPASGQCRHSASGRQQGFTLPEAVTAAAIAGVLLSLATPALRSLALKNHMTTEVNVLMAVLNSTRGEAIKRGSTVTVCTSLNGTNCSDDSGWREGWIVFADLNKNHVLDDGETVIRVQQGWQGPLALRYGGPKESYSYLTYYPEGYARPNATFTFCDSRGPAKAKTILINTVGRPRTSTKDSENKQPDCSWASS